MVTELEKLKVIVLKKEPALEIEIIGNRAGLKFLAEVCNSLSELSDEEAKTAANHYHIDRWMYNAEEGLIPMTILYKPDF